VASKTNPNSVGKTSLKNRLTGNGKPPVGTEVLEVKPKKNKMAVAPAKEVCRCACLPFRYLCAGLNWFRIFRPGFTDRA